MKAALVSIAPMYNTPTIHYGSVQWMRAHAHTYIYIEIQAINRFGWFKEEMGGGGGGGRGGAGRARVEQVCPV